MNILHLNTYTYSKNLSFPHYQFHKELLGIGENSIIVSAKGDINENEIIILKKGSLLPFFGISRLVRKVLFEILIKNKTNYFYPEWNLDFITLRKITKKLPFKPDVILTYWTKFAFNQKLIYKLSKYYNAPVICIPMDMAPFTGGCHYSGTCERYKQNCEACPILKSNFLNFISQKTWNYKHEYIRKTELSVLVATSTMQNQINSSSLFFDKKINKLLLSIDENLFRPKEKNEARYYFNLPTNKKIIFIGAASLTETRKGISYFFEALNILIKMEKNNFTSDDIFVLFAGKNLENISIPFAYKHVGYLKTQNELALAYQACDLFACPSIEDSGPLMINQAIMSGRPVVSFNIGVAPDLVIDNKTGYIAEIKNSNDFAIGLIKILNLSNTDWQIMSNNCRSLGLQELSSILHPKKLLSIFESTIKDNKNK